jgi:hypothetical protein
MKMIESVMNVNVLEHQRSILATMGIDLWIPQVGVQTRHYQTALYRDIEQADQTSLSPIEFSTLLTDATETNPSNSVTVSVQVEKLQLSEVSLLKRNPETQRTEEITVSKQIQQQTRLEVEVAVELSPFEIQAYCLEHCILLVETTRLEKDQLSLWGNIQRAISGHTHELKWPFPMLQFQDGRGVNLYIQGFIDALKQEQKIMSLGQMSYLAQQDIIALPSLQEMLDEPLLKRRLWQMMQK